MLTKQCILRIIGHSIFPVASILCLIVSLGMDQWLRYHFVSTNTRTGYYNNNNYHNNPNNFNNPFNHHGNGYNLYSRGNGYNNNIRPVSADKDLTISFGLYKICVEDDCKKYCDADPSIYTKLGIIVHFNRDSTSISPPHCDTNLGPTKGLCIFSIFIMTFQLLLTAYIFSAEDMGVRSTRIGGHIKLIHLAYGCLVLGTSAGLFILGGVIHFVRKTGGFDTLALDYVKGWTYWWSTLVAGLASLWPFLQWTLTIRIINCLHYEERQGSGGTAQTGNPPPPQQQGIQVVSHAAPYGQGHVSNTAYYPNGAPVGMQPAAPHSYGYNPGSQTLYPSGPQMRT